MDSTGTQPNTTPSKDDIQLWLRRRVAESIQGNAEDIDTSLPFAYYGLDSVASLGISGDLEIWLGRKLPQTLTWDYPNIDLLSAFLADG
jgi:acyl carrier protein